MIDAMSGTRSQARRACKRDLCRACSTAQR